MTSSDGKLTPSACKHIMDFSEKEAKVRHVCNLSKIKIRPEDGRVYILIKRKSLSSTSYIGLVEKLYEHFFGIENVTMEEFFELWMKWRTEETKTNSGYLIIKNVFWTG